MRKRLIEKLTKSKQGTLGYTLTEMLVVVGIIAILCAIAIPSVMAIMNAVRFARANNYAKSIFLAAQQNLTEMRSDGGLGPVRSASDAYPIDVDTFPDEYRNEYRYTFGGTTAFDRILPVGSVDASIRDDQIVIEYNPITGNVYAVFYYERNDINLHDEYTNNNLPHGNEKADKNARKELMVGYYDGSGLNSSQIELEQTSAQVEYVNGEEGIVRVLVPIPDSYYERLNDFISGLSIDLSITGESLDATDVNQATADPLQIRIKDVGDTTGYQLTVDGTCVVYEFAIDSLANRRSFVNYISGTQEAQAGQSNSNEKSLTKLMSETDFSVYNILPGQNITVEATVEFTGSGSELVQIAPGILSGINPMFEYLLPSGDGYILAVSNGRNLQNLNAIAPSVADRVVSVVFTDDVYWNDTVSYYNEKYGTGSTYTNTNDDGVYDEAPARALPYFVPIHNEALFGTARFIFPGEGDGGLGGILEDILDSIFGGYSNSAVPTLTDEMDNVPDDNNITGAQKHATIQGDGYKVYNLNIDSNKYAVPNDVADLTTATQDQLDKIGRFYATGGNQIVDYYFTGLFGYVNTPISDLDVVNPIIKGHGFEDRETVVMGYDSWWDALWGNATPQKAYVYGNPATGALLGAGGFNTLVTNCSTYIDKSARGYMSSSLGHGSFDFSADNAYENTVQTWYGVSGEGAVGGLVGYAKSHRNVSGVLTNDKSVLAFSNCFAAVPVTGNMRNNADKHYGYSNGVGSFIGNSQITNFYNCYASGNVKASNVRVTRFTGSSLQQGIFDLGAALFGSDLKVELLNNGRTSWGAGGFVGTSHGTRYTNCFATGNVTASASTSYGGAGGFVGFMSIDETFKYGNDSDNTSLEETIAQRTVFTRCYSVGQAVTNNTTYENFSGANGRISFNIDQFNANLLGDYYRLYAPYYHMNGGSTPNFEGAYIYRDSYFMSGYTDGANTNSGTCAEAELYSTFENLVGKHTKVSEWMEGQIQDIKDIVIATHYIIDDETYKSNYFDEHAGGNGVKSLEQIYQDLYDWHTTQAGESEPAASGWRKAAASSTHPYSINTTGAVYPFSILAGLDYYGDWPSKPSAIGLAYYEAYESEPNKNHFFFDKEHDSNASLKLSDGENIMVVKDGYAIFSANNAPLTVTIGNVSDTLYVSDESYTVSNNSYHVFYLSDKLMDAMPEDGEFYCTVTATHGGGNVYTMYFNPNVALSHANPVEGNHDADKPDQAPATIYVRSARQFAAISELDDFWTQGTRYIQQLNIDADEYLWSQDATAEVASIGTLNDPFNASYTGSYTNTAGQPKQYTISGFEPTEAGFFGVIGEYGSVSDLIVECTDVTAGANGDITYTAVLAGTNHGTLDNVDLTITGNVSLKATGAAGILSGYSDGIITDCDVQMSPDKTLTIEAPTAGGLVGIVNGTADQLAQITGTDLVLGKFSAPNAEFVGGYIGQVTNAAVEQFSVSVNNLTAPAGIHVGGLAGYAENTDFTGVNNLTEISITGTLKSEAGEGYTAAALASGKNVTLTGVDVSAQYVDGFNAAGFLGSGENVDASNCDIVIHGYVKGNSGAATVACVIGPQSVFSDVNATITGATIEATAGDAAGYALEISGEAYVSNSVVTLGSFSSNSTATIKATGNAAGFAEIVNGSVGTSHVAGRGSISGADAAGFAVQVNGAVATCYVSPALTADATGYTGNSNDNLTVNGSNSAAGFALTVGKNGTITYSYMLGSITSSGKVTLDSNSGSTEGTGASGETTGDATSGKTVTSAYGFVGTNNGTIERCVANVNINGGFAFVGFNESLLSKSYGWYFSNSEIQSMTGSGKCYNSYFAKLNAAHKDACHVVYDAQGSMSLVTATMLQSIGLEGFTTGYNEFPYTEMTPAEYPYPMLRDHYGNWLTPPQYAYGIAYYEFYADGSVKIHMADLGDTSITEEGKAGLAIDGTYKISGDTVTKDAAFDNSGDIEETGYAKFYNTETGDHDNDGTKLDLTVSLADGFTYSFYKVANDGIVTVGKTTTGSKTAKFDTRFADEIVVNGDFDNVYTVRTSDQLANIGNYPSATFNQTHDIVLTDNFATVTGFAGTYNGGGFMIKKTGAVNQWMNGVNGTVQNVNLILGDLNGSFFGDVNVSVSLNSLSIGSIAEGGSLIGTLNGNLACSSTTVVSGNLNGTIISTANVDTTLNVQAQSINGNGAVVGTVNAEKTVTLNLTYSGDISGSIVNNVYGTITLNNALNLGTVSGKLFDVVSGTVNLSNGVTVATLSGSLVESMTGTVNAGAVKVEALSGTLIATLKNGTVQTSTVDVTTLDGSLVNTFDGGTMTTGNITVGTANKPLVTAFNGGILTGGESKSAITMGNIVNVNYLFGETVSGTVKHYDVAHMSGSTGLAGTLSGSMENMKLTVTTDSMTVDVINTFNGSTLSGLTVEITGSMSGNLIDTASKAVSDLTLTVGGDMTGNAIGTASGNITTLNLTVSGELQSSVIGTFSGSTLSGAVVKAKTIAPSEPVNGILVNCNSGSITGSSVEAETITVTTSGNFGVIADQLSGTMGTTTVNVKNLNVTVSENSTIGGLVGTNNGTITGCQMNYTAQNSDAANTVMTVDNTAGKTVTIGGFVGVNSNTIQTGADVKADITYIQQSATVKTDAATIGGLVGQMSGGTLSGANVSGSILLTNDEQNAAAEALAQGIELTGELLNPTAVESNRSYIVGGAIGSITSGTVDNVSTTGTISDTWAGAKLVNTNIVKYVDESDVDAITAICPAGFGPVGKFVGYVSGDSLTNCSAVGSATTTAYQFLGEIKPGTADLQHDSLYRRASDYKDSFTLESATDLCTPGETKAWTEWVADTILKSGDDYRVFGITLSNCSFDLSTGEIANQVYTANYDFYKHDDSNYTEVKLFKSGAKIEGNISFVDANKTFADLYETYAPSNLPGTNSAQTEWYYNHNGTYKKVTIVTERKQSGNLVKYESEQIVYIKDSAGNVLASANRTNNRIWWEQWSKEETGLLSLRESVDPGTAYVLVSEDGSKMMAIVNGVSTSVETPASFTESDSYLWNRSNGTFTSVKTSAVTFAATLNLSADSYSSTTQPYVFDGVSYYLHAYTESSHGYTATFVPSGESNMVCHYQIKQEATESTSITESDLPAESGEAPSTENGNN